MPQRPLNNTAIVVLGLVAAGRRNGYEIAQAVKRSTSYFWTASPGGIYPELRRLHAAGLLVLADDPRGDAERHSYELTRAGEHALRDWLLDDSDGRLDMRHEDLLRLFLSADLQPDEQREILRRVRESHERRADALERETAPHAPADPANPRRIVLDYGIALHRGAAQWCADAEARLARG